MHVSHNDASKTSSTLVSLMMVVSILLVGATPTVSAVGPNQNDMGMTSGDLPDNLSSVNITNYIFSAAPCPARVNLTSGTTTTTSVSP